MFGTDAFREVLSAGGHFSIVAKLKHYDHPISTIMKRYSVPTFCGCSVHAFCQHRKYDKQTIYRRSTLWLIIKPCS